MFLSGNHSRAPPYYRGFEGYGKSEKHHSGRGNFVFDGAGSRILRGWPRLSTDMSSVIHAGRAHGMVGDTGLEPVTSSV